MYAAFLERLQALLCRAELPSAPRGAAARRNAGLLTLGVAVAGAVQLSALEALMQARARAAVCPASAVG